MNGTRLPYAISTPLTSPATAPTVSAQRIMTTAPYDCVCRVVAQTDASATSAPTDRSMPPPMMTSVTPTVTTPMTEELTRMFSMLLLVRKVSLVTVPTTTRTMSTATSPRLRTSTFAQRPRRPTRPVAVLGCCGTAPPPGVTPGGLVG